MLRPGRTSLVLALALVALGASGCGDSGDEEGTIAQDDADTLLALVDEIEAKVGARDCSSAQTDISELTGEINELPAEVGVETKDALRRMSDQLSELTATQCEEAESAVSLEPGPEEPAETTPPTTSTSTSTEEETEPPPEQPDDEGTGLPPNGPPGPEGNPNNEGGEEDEDTGGGIEGEE